VCCGPEQRIGWEVSSALAGHRIPGNCGDGLSVGALARGGWSKEAAKALALAYYGCTCSGACIGSAEREACSMQLPLLRQFHG
jgi:hypothetical protein